jgi:hypothetical protein
MLGMITAVTITAMSTLVHWALFNYQRGGLTQPEDTELICHRGYWDFTGGDSPPARPPTAIRPQPDQPLP